MCYPQNSLEEGGRAKVDAVVEGQEKCVGMSAFS